MKQENSEIGKKVLTDGLDPGYILTLDNKDLGMAFNLTSTLENGFLSKNARNGSKKIINWMIKNDGKQTIIVL